MCACVCVQEKSPLFRSFLPAWFYFPLQVCESSFFSFLFSKTLHESNLANCCERQARASLPAPTAAVSASTQVLLLFGWLQVGEAGGLGGSVEPLLRQEVGRSAPVL